MSIFVIGLNHQSAPVSVRERLAFADAAIPDALARLRAGGLATEGVILSTCNRVELYVSTPKDDPEALRRFLLEDRHFDGPLTNEIYALGEPQSVEHLFKVACGLDSMVLGETEILGQLKKAYDLALQHRHTGARLNKTFQRAFNVAKHIRTRTGIQRGNISVASVAVDLAEKIFSKLAEHTVMVLGAGDTGEKTARALSSRSAGRILVSNRSAEKAVALAGELGGQAVPFDQWNDALARIDILICSTAAPEPVVTRAQLTPLMKLRRNRSLLLVDLAVPRNIEPAVGVLDNVYLYNVDNLQAIADDGLKQRRDEIALCESIIRERASILCRNGFSRP